MNKQQRYNLYPQLLYYSEDDYEFPYSPVGLLRYSLRVHPQLAVDPLLGKDLSCRLISKMIDNNDR